MSAHGQTPIEPVPDDFLAQNSEAIDARAIMETVRRRVAEKQRAGVYRGLPRLALQTPPPPGAARRADERLALVQMWARQSLEGEPISSHRPIVGRFVVAWKRFTRFWIRRYTDSLFLRQQMFNEEVAALLQELSEEIRTQRRESEDQDRQE
jgi:hypothetical protein